jgi:ketosteroid isomerase-like protein
LTAARPARNFSRDTIRGITMRKTLITAATLLAATALGGCHMMHHGEHHGKADAARIAEAVKADVHQLIADFNAHDAAKAVSHDGEGYVGMFHGAPNVVGAAQDLALTKQQVADPAARVDGVTDETVDVAEHGDMAVYRATYSFTSTDPATKKPVTEKGNWLLGYKPQADGSWKTAWSVVSNTGAGAAATPASAATATP